MLPGSEGICREFSMTHPRQVSCCRSHWPRQATRRLRADSTASDEVSLTGSRRKCQGGPAARGSIMELRTRARWARCVAVVILGLVVAMPDARAQAVPPEQLVALMRQGGLV